MRIEDHMKASNRTQSDAARDWGVSRQLISHWIKREAIVVDGRVYLPVRGADKTRA